MSLSKTVDLHSSWMALIGNEFEQPYMHSLRDFLKEEKQQRKVIYPRSSDWFNAFNATPVDKVKVVILGQDPYHGPGQAHGLCFSVQPGVRLPPSLLNILKELNQDLGIEIPQSGSLQRWAEQGVLLLNSSLTVEHGKAGSHQNKGWERFTDAAIQAIEKKKDNLVFMLWGSYAQKKGQFIDGNRHLVLKSVHPSPLSAHRGFFGNKHFSQANLWLTQHGVSPIDWNP